MRGSPEKEYAFLREHLQDTLGVPLVYTFGYVAMNVRSILHTPLKRQEKMLKDGVPIRGKQFVDVDDFGMELVYKPDRKQLPALETVLRFPVARR
ncbi:hypothetical protein ACW7GZ_00010 [Luteimonas sp. A537]